MRTLLSISVSLLAGLIMTRFFKPLKLPSVTAYLIAGVLIGPYCIGTLGIPGIGFSDSAAVGELSLFSEIALGLIAFSIGNEFRMASLKKTGRQAGCCHWNSAGTGCTVVGGFGPFGYLSADAGENYNSAGAHPGCHCNGNSAGCYPNGGAAV